MNSSRRNFLDTSALLATTVALSSFSPIEEKQALTHHVFFWLKNPESAADKAKLIEGINTLKKIDTLRGIKIGTPAATPARPVIDSTYSISLLTFFADVKGHNAYQEHPIHLQFVEKYSYLWEKVQVYDSLDI